MKVDGGNEGCSFNYQFEISTKKNDLVFNNQNMYFVRNKATGEVWFVGTVYETKSILDPYSMNIKKE